MMSAYHSAPIQFAVRYQRMGAKTALHPEQSAIQVVRVPLIRPRVAADP
jgi:hypothetical protein